MKTIELTEEQLSRLCSLQACVIDTLLGSIERTQVAGNNYVTDMYIEDLKNAEELYAALTGQDPAQIPFQLVG